MSFSLTVPGVGVGLMGTGSLGNVHEVALELHSQQAKNSGFVVQELDRNNALVFGEAPEWAPNRNLYKNGLPKKQSRDASTLSKKTLLAALSGKWNVAPLHSTISVHGMMYDETTTEAKAMMTDPVVCGAVLWHVDTVGDTTADAASQIRQMAMNGAGWYNDNKETEEFRNKMGGLIVGRMTWDNMMGYHPNNDALADGDDRKLRHKNFEGSQAAWGPDWIFTPVSNYLEEVWPVLRGKDQHAYPASKMKDRATLRQVTPSTMYSIFAGQEYLAGRILTTRMEENDRTAAHMIVLFTYSCPEGLEDASVLDEPIGVLPVKVLRDPKALIQWGMSHEESQVCALLKSVSFRRLKDLMEWSILRNTDAPVENRIQLVPCLVQALVSQSSPGYRFLSLLHDMIGTYHFTLFGAFVTSLSEAGLLSKTIQVAKQDWEVHRHEEYTTSIPPKVLLALAPTVKCVELLLETGLIPDLSVVRATMDRPEIFDRLRRLSSRTQDRSELVLSALREFRSDTAKRLWEECTDTEKSTLVASNSLPIILEQTGKAPLVGNLGHVALGSFLLLDDRFISEEKKKLKRECLFIILQFLQERLGVEVVGFDKDHGIWNLLASGNRRRPHSNSVEPKKELMREVLAEFARRTATCEEEEKTSPDEESQRGMNEHDIKSAFLHAKQTCGVYI